MLLYLFRGCFAHALCWKMSSVRALLVVQQVENVHSGKQPNKNCRCLMGEWGEGVRERIPPRRENTMNAGDPVSPWVKQRRLPQPLPQTYLRQNRLNVLSNTLLQIPPKTLHKNVLWTITTLPQARPLLPVPVLPRHRILRVSRSVPSTMERAKPLTPSIKCPPSLKNARPARRWSSHWIVKCLPFPAPGTRRSGNTLLPSNSTTRSSGRAGKLPKNTFKRW